jgi:Leucine-rich repeat (LRR) protein
MLRELPDQMGMLSRLQELSVANNQLARLPYSFGQVRTLFDAVTATTPNQACFLHLARR